MHTLSRVRQARAARGKSQARKPRAQVAPALRALWTAEAIPIFSRARRPATPAPLQRPRRRLRRPCTCGPRRRRVPPIGELRSCIPIGTCGRVGVRARGVASCIRRARARGRAARLRNFFRQGASVTENPKAGRNQTLPSEHYVSAICIQRRPSES